MRGDRSRLPRRAPSAFIRFALVAMLAVAGAAAGAQSPELSDRNITTAIENEFIYDYVVPFDRVDVLVAEGLVTLTGRVDSLLAKERAGQIAAAVRGVRDVSNMIRVRPRPDMTPAEIERSVSQGLLMNGATESYKIDVEATEAGVVVLKGTVGSWAERRLAGEVAKNIRGVTEVDNRIEVADDTDVSDAQIRGDVRDRLAWNVMVDDALIDVEVNDGVVRLSGQVGTVAEKMRAETLAWVKGVRDVRASDLVVRSLARDEYRRDTAGMDDGDIEDAIRDALGKEPVLKDFDVSVDVADGEATLRGVVDTLAAKRTVTRAARQTLGVIAIDNRIKVRPSGSYGDEAIAKNVRAAIVNDPVVRPSDLTVDVDGGIVRLGGVVDTYYEKVRAENDAAAVKGVVGIRNRIAVDRTNVPYVYDPYLDYLPGASYGWYDYQPRLTQKSDKEIADDIRDQLWWSPFVDSDALTVSVEDGVATLTGSVDSWKESSAAVSNAYQGGATWVVNDLEIERLSGS